MISIRTFENSIVTYIEKTGKIVRGYPFWRYYQQPCRHAGQSGINAGVKKNYKKTPDIFRGCPDVVDVRRLKKLLKNAGHLSGVKIQIKSEITPDAAGQNDGLSAPAWRQGRYYHSCLSTVYWAYGHANI